MIAVAALAAFGALAQGSLTVTHEAPDCMSPLCGRTPINAFVSGPSAPASVRVYFHAGSEGPDYYVEMMRVEGDGYIAVLPSALRDTISVTYRIMAVADDSSITSTEPVTLPVTSDCQLRTLTEDELNFAMNSIIGLTDASQTGAPKGFSCAGLVEVVGVDQMMGPNSACEEIRLAESDSCFSPAGAPMIANAAAGSGAKVAGGILGTGIGGTTAAIIGGAIVAGAVIIENNNDDDREPVSRARP
jgi:hypothetical protein